MPAPRPTQDFDTMTTRSGASKRSWRSADTAPRASTSSVASSSSAKSESLRVTGILSALAPVHQPRRQTSPAPTHESRRRDSLSPAAERRRATSPAPTHESWRGHSPTPTVESRQHLSVRTASPTIFSPRTSHFPASPRNDWNNRDAQPLSVPSPRRPHYVKASPKWNATFTNPTPIPTSPVARSPRPHDSPSISRLQVPSRDSSRAPSPAPEVQKDEQTHRKEQGWSGEWSGAQGMDDVVRSLRRLRVK
ncbi:hypothetical protein DFH08DRAFT_865666 [Mycena albidolilacea]|uniref:Uncharacterized protein n=1 Tax=Mycena albidolilacea TaxID=1033008 RepID=A0AAD7ERD3_9AGAR|nr:hypothetical protein DFH08DRAFT_865666 [Mycena albidolilacea]